MSNKEDVQDRIAAALAEAQKLLSINRLGDFLDWMYTTIENSYAGPRSINSSSADPSKILISLAQIDDPNLDLVVQVMADSARKKFFEILNAADTIYPELAALIEEKVLHWHTITFVEPDIPSEDKVIEDGEADLIHLATQYFNDSTDQNSDKQEIAKKIQDLLDNSRLKTSFIVYEQQQKNAAAAAKAIGIQDVKISTSNHEFDSGKHSVLMHFVDFYRKFNPPPTTIQKKSISEFAKHLSDEDLILFCALFSAHPNTKRKNEIVGLFLGQVTQPPERISLFRPKES